MMDLEEIGYFLFMEAQEANTNRSINNLSSPWECKPPITQNEDEKKDFHEIYPLWGKTN